MSEPWHWEVKGEEHHSPIVWLLFAWTVILGGLAYVVWQVLRSVQMGG